MVEVPIMPSRPISALGNQYVTFQPDQQEIATFVVLFNLEIPVALNSVSIGRNTEY